MRYIACPPRQTCLLRTHRAVEPFDMARVDPPPQLQPLEQLQDLATTTEQPSRLHPQKIAARITHLVDHADQQGLAAASGRDICVAHGHGGDGGNASRQTGRGSPADRGDARRLRSTTAAGGDNRRPGAHVKPAKLRHCGSTYCRDKWRRLHWAKRHRVTISSRKNRFIDYKPS